MAKRRKPTRAMIESAARKLDLLRQTEGQARQALLDATPHLGSESLNDIYKRAETNLLDKLMNVWRDIDVAERASIERGLAWKSSSSSLLFWY